MSPAKTAAMRGGIGDAPFRAGSLGIINYAIGLPQALPADGFFCDPTVETVGH